MFTPKTNYAKIAFDAILFFVSTGQVRKTNESKISSDLKLKMACIVSIYDVNDNLIGQYGNVNPKNDFLYDEIIENAIGAASKDKSNKPIKNDQLNQIKVFVDVLSSPHEIEDKAELKPQKHGLIIKDKTGKTGFIMPNMKGIKTVDKQIEKIKFDYKITEDIENLELYYFKSTRYD